MQHIRMVNCFVLICFYLQFVYSNLLSIFFSSCCLSFHSGSSKICLLQRCELKFIACFKIKYRANCFEQLLYFMSVLIYNLHLGCFLKQNVDQLMILNKKKMANKNGQIFVVQFWQRYISLKKREPTIYSLNWLLLKFPKELFHKTINTEQKD